MRRIPARQLMAKREIERTGEKILPTNGRGPKKKDRSDQVRIERTKKFSL